MRGRRDLERTNVSDRLKTRWHVRPFYWYYLVEIMQLCAILIIKRKMYVKGSQ